MGVRINTYNIATLHSSFSGSVFEVHQAYPFDYIMIAYLKETKVPRQNVVFYFFRQFKIVLIIVLLDLVSCGHSILLRLIVCW